MNHDDLQELTEAYVLGELAQEERHTLEAHLATCPRCAATVRELLTVTEGLGRAVELRDPPARLREHVMSSALPEYSFLLAGAGWKRHSVPGVSFKELRFERSTGQATLLLTLEPGARYPDHRHSGAEQCLVLAGDISAGGRRLGPGDFHYAGAGSVHEGISSEHGCTIMLIVSADDYRGSA